MLCSEYCRHPHRGDEDEDDENWAGESFTQHNDESAPVSVQVEEATHDCPQCSGTAEPEQDGDVRFWVCTDEECGAEFGYEQVKQPADGPLCPAGLPISEVMQAEPEPVFLGASIGRRPG